MTAEEVKHIQSLLDQGCGYRKIATLTGISVNTVKAYCSRHKNDRPIIDPTQTYCRECGRPITCIPKHRQRQFCSDLCRMTYWNAHRDLVQHKRIYTFQCRFCGQEFESRGDPNRKYCSRSCADKAKRKGAILHGN